MKVGWDGGNESRTEDDNARAPRGGPSDAVAIWNTALATILTNDQETVVDAYAGYAAASSVVVGAAMENALPVG